MLLPCNWLIVLLLSMIGNCMGASESRAFIEFDTMANQKKQHEVNVDDEEKAQSGERSKHYAKIGWSKNQETPKTNPRPTAMNKKFEMINGLSSLVRIFKLICLLLFIGLNVDCIHFN
ncbi:hypothetical protein J1N35_022644 [Gossypium stocksii]|uniref:Uncharacterized protein n=1 Tax=Gossypium stocksii TaxID=47602 RepID=A0A9D4A2G0_9ROSI|nr:hypothetical protein J1N35_022644 [Gossypium stocksii]